MRIASAISVHRTGPIPARPAAARPLYLHAITEIAAAPTLPPPRQDDAAWLTLLMTQMLAGPRLPDMASAQLAYAGPAGTDGPIFAVLA